MNHLREIAIAAQKLIRKEIFTEEKKQRLEYSKDLEIVVSSLLRVYPKEYLLKEAERAARLGKFEKKILTNTLEWTVEQGTFCKSDNTTKEMNLKRKISIQRGAHKKLIDVLANEFRGSGVRIQFEETKSSIFFERFTRPASDYHYSETIPAHTDFRLSFYIKLSW